MHKLKFIFKVLIIILTIGVILYMYFKSFIFKTTYLDYIETYCKGSGIDPYLVLSIIKVESGFNPNAVSSKEAKGLMQITDTIYDDILDRAVTSDDNFDIYNPETNIRAGIAYFRKLISKYNGNYYIALLAYNAGMGNVDSWIKQGIIPKDLDYYVVPEVPFKETKNYLKKVMSTYNIYKFLYNI